MDVKIPAFLPYIDTCLIVTAVSGPGLVNAIKRLFPEVETMDQAEEVAKRWAPYRTMACWYLWRTLDPIPVEY